MTCTLSLPLTTSEGKVKSKVFDIACGLFPVKSKRTVWEYVCSNPSAYQNKDRIIVISNRDCFRTGVVCLLYWGIQNTVRYFVVLVNTRNLSYWPVQSERRSVLFVKIYFCDLLFKTTRQRQKIHPPSQWDSLWLVGLLPSNLTHSLILWS